jgi:hypothetical protein
MIKQIFLSFSLALLLGLCLPAAANDKTATRLATKSKRKEDTSMLVPLRLIEDTQAWSQRADFWRLVARGEELAERLEIIAIKSNLLEAWVCGPEKVCVSTRLLRELPPAEQEAVIAHEIGHLLIPRNYAAHPQLWEAQCDLFAATLLRDAQQVIQMLGTLAADCPNCSDAQHPKPEIRMQLVDLLSDAVLTKIVKFDEFRRRSYAVNYKIKPGHVPAELRQLSFALQPASTAAAVAAAQARQFKLEELKMLDFAIGFDAKDGFPADKQQP